MNTPTENKGCTCTSFAIEIGDTLVNSIQEKLDDVSPLSSECCIFRVPEQMRKINEEAYRPRMVSLGPFHYGKQRLAEMEEHKKRYLKSLLRRNPSIKLEAYVNTMRELENRARKCYAETISLSSDQFVEMMLLDGCFIIAYFFMCENPSLRSEFDPVFHAAWTDAGLYHDMVLLENQIPFFVLEYLFKLVNTTLNYKNSLVELSFSVFEEFLQKEDRVPNQNPNSSQVKHLLDLLRNYHLPSSERKKPKGDPMFNLPPTATELQEAGVKFKMITSNSWLDIRFNEGVLEIPNIKIEDATEVFLRNLLAFEQCYMKNSTLYFVDYLLFMDSLINTSKDVGLLRGCGIIDNLLGDDEEVAHLFNKLGKGVVMSENDNFYYLRLCQDVQEYYKNPLHRWRAKLVHDYFNTPWAIISFIAAVLLLLLTFIQTIYSVKSYIKGK
ncbi:PREDICTED: UPF0481 protein At3g47200-like [Nelumbo nucifera]|uniref:Uncharacterized protein n=2 Tax=Nelumbo nucifera TaxID=4432 RepID=A0A822YI69_NELNU|nr:PREDICTED: UPF0481 protein At3g47200-like [Nelumbo nucifera]DAD32217.1 TPA_asm: hypothetical protein HUJ06_011068 [Nelumbo nucifera]